MATRTSKQTKAKPYSRADKVPSSKTNSYESPFTGTQLDFPLTPSERAFYSNPKTGKKVTAFQWKIYDYISTIPKGRVTTYGLISKELDSSPRAVGSALRNNPFAPLVPCHRIIAGTGFIGGFGGEWGTDGSKNQKGTGANCIDKLALLKAEGVDFNDKGFLISKQLVWPN